MERSASSQRSAGRDYVPKSVPKAEAAGLSIGLHRARPLFKPIRAGADSFADQPDTLPVGKGSRSRQLRQQKLPLSWEIFDRLVDRPSQKCIGRRREMSPCVARTKYVPACVRVFFDRQQ